MLKRAVLIVNLGSPESTSIPDVRRYLREFLGDERVLDLPSAVRWALLEGIILRTRPKRSAHAYSNIWTDRKSTRLNSSHQIISYAVFCLKKKKIIHLLNKNSASAPLPLRF